MQFKIGKYTLSDKHPSFIVAELSGNHGGSLNRAIKLINYAKKAGANAVKLQTYKADTITFKSKNKDFIINSNSPWSKFNNYWDLYDYAHTPWSWHKTLFKTAKDIGLEIFSSPFDETAVDLLENLRCPAYKIASSEINHIPLIERVAKTKKPVILSIGLANLKDIYLAIKTLKKNGCKEIAILKCVASYPSPLSEQNLKVIPDIKKRFNVLSGLSDHTTGNACALASVVIGGSIVEKHFNLQDKSKTVDSFFSSNFKKFKEMVENIRSAEQAIGKVDYNISKSSKKNLNGRRSIYVVRPIKKGEKFTTKNIRVIRPGYGLHPKFFKKILGKISKKKLKEGTRFKKNFVRLFE